MSRNLVINTATNDRLGKKWTPSPELAIQEEQDGDEFSGSTNSSKLSQQGLIEEEEAETEEEEEEEEEEENDSDYTSSPSIPDENINFDLVYTLHTFEATVDGQASVKKGDALTLLDDSNSYWWLIRDIKTSEVGYIPAENIETPFERLARLNKHRNVELTSIEQAAHYIKDDKQPSTKANRKRVVLSTSLNVQLHVILVGEDDEDEPEDCYEEWNEEMLDDDDDEVEEEDEQTTITNDDKSSNPKESSKNNNTTTVAAAAAAAATVTEIQKQASFINKTDTGFINNHATPATTTTTTDPVGQTSRAPEQITTSKVLRVFAGNVDVGASYHSVRVTESTTVDELLISAMEKFHISQIENKHHGRSNKNSGIEYFLTVKSRDGDEITLDPKDKPFAIHESLTAYLTTPMPSLTQFKQLAASTPKVFSATDDNNANKNSSSNIRKKKRSLYDTSIQFFMHKRIKRVNNAGKVHIKVSLMTAPVTEKLNTIQKITRFGIKKKLGGPLEERIDKLIAIPGNMSIADLTSTALVKFHIISDENQPHQYRLILCANGKDTLLNSNQILSDVLRGSQDTTTRYFVLHNFQDQQRTPLILSSSTSSSSTSSFTNNRQSKVFPDNGDSFYSHHPVMTRLDSTTESILKRIDAALESYEKTNRVHHHRKVNNSPMSVSRNESGIDIHLPHGLLRSTTLDGKKTQYSLMTSPNTLVLQKVLPADRGNSSKGPIAAAARTGSGTGIKVSGEEMATLIKYGSQYLDTYDTANKPSLFSASNRLYIDKEKSLSSLDDLDKEFQRIIKSHSS